MHSSAHARARVKAPRVALAASLALLAAWPAAAASVTQMRVGQHPDFTRVVFELDLPAGYAVERRLADDGTPLLVISLEASVGPATPPRIASPSALLESVVLTDLGERTVATVRLREPDLPVKEMILKGPPRIVLDVLGRDTALVQKPTPRAPAVARAPAPAPKPAPAPQTVARPAAPPEPEPAPAQRVEPRPAPEPAPQPAPAPQTVARPAAPPEPTPEPAPARQATRTSPAPPGPEPGVGPATPAEPGPGPEEAAGAPERDPHAEQAAREAMERRLAAVREAAEKRQRQLEAEREARRQEEPGAEGEPAAAAPAPAGEQGSGPSRLLLGGGVVLALLLVILTIARVRRRKAPEDDFDVMALGEAAAPPARARPSEDARASEPLVGGGEPLFRGGEPKQAAPSAPGLFEEPEKGDQAMETQVHDTGAAVRPRGGADVTKLLAEFERRISHLEAGLEEANAARERLERQVAAQSEELRVQRAAIARTQRALRGLSRSDEEQATEPALRD